MLHERQTELFRFTLERRDHWYFVTAWGRINKNSPWRQMYFGRCYRCYIEALKAYNDDAAAERYWHNTLLLA